ncbi:MAG: TonB family protein [Bdellovibrionaceae bacterium]|nr:TonB family protein [Bdellovibrio sp.]
MSSHTNYIDIYGTQNEESSKYFGLSMVLHAALVIGSFYVVIPTLEKLNKEVITIELQSSEEALVPPPLKTLAPAEGEKIVATKGAEQVLAPAPSALIEAEKAAVIAAPVPKAIISKAKSAQIKTHTGGAAGPAAVVKSAPSRAGVPETLEDIAAPDLDTDGVVAAQVGNLGDNEFENEFKKVDHSNAAAIMAEKAVLDEETKQVADEKDAALQAIEDQNRAKAKAMEDALAATRNKNAASLAEMKATEQAAAQKAAREAQLAAAAAAEAEAARNKGAGENAASEGRGNGSEGEDQASAVVAGEPNGVRSLDQLKQIPGNPKPQYSNEERLRRQNGDVVFYAFITKTGSPTQFKMVQSTGHRNLDVKTLAALKKWKFYPGQQGWVEIPFKWDLKGGVQEMPASLRRFGARN